MKTIIVIPTYNEAENIEKLIKKIFALDIPELEILIVDDNSPDNTSQIVKILQSPRPAVRCSEEPSGSRREARDSKAAFLPAQAGCNLHLITRPGKLGLGSAYIAGFKKALELRANFIFEMDADFSHDPDDIPHLLAAAQKADLVIGSRKIKGGKIIGWSPWRKFMSNGAMYFSRILLGIKAHDVTAGFRCFRRQVLETIKLDGIQSSGYAFQEELLYRTEQADFIVTEVPVTFVDRQEGKSKLSKKDIWEFFVKMIKLKLLKQAVKTTRLSTWFFF